MRFDDFPYTRPDRDSLSAQHAAHLAAFQNAADDAGRLAAIRAWDEAQRHYGTLQSIASIRFTQDTASEQAQAERRYFDELGPVVAELRVAFLQAVLAHPALPALEEALGRQAIGLWRQQLLTFDPALANPLRQESELVMRYDALMAQQRFECQGESHTFSTVARLFGSADRATRLAAHQGRSQALAGIGDQIDDIFDELHRVRAGMAQTLGDARFTELGYRRMGRTDYGPAEVARFREDVERELVPLCARILERRAEAIGVTDPGVHDEGIRDPRGQPTPKGDAAWMLGQAETLFDQLGGPFGGFFRSLVERGLLDLEAREGKAGGGYCDYLPDHQAPFIFANFNGSQGDARVFTHECGHAFQVWSARQQPLSDYLWPTYEAAEIHSMSLELLTFPQMELFFGDDAERFRQGHLESAILFLPWGCVIDAFQHLVYDRPQTTGAERNAMWRDCTRRFQPWRRFPGMPHLEAGGGWMRIPHLFHTPFYAIDYCLAQTCALQFWHLAEQDRADALARYQALCRLGGSRSFLGLLDSVGLDSPFTPGVLARVVQTAARTLGF